MNLTGERVRQIERKALCKLRHPSRSRRLRRVVGRNEILQSPEETNCHKSIIVEKIAAYIEGRSSNVGFFTQILQKNELVIEGNDIVGTNAGNIAIEELEFGAREYNCLKRSGVNTMADLLTMTAEDLMKVRNLGRKSAEEVLARVKAYKTGEMKLTIDKVLTSKYTTVRVIYKGVEQTYKFKCMSTNEVAECVYEVLVEECSKKGTILDYKMSFELKFLLLCKGYFFVENMLEDFECIVSELTSGMYEIYADEFKTVVKKIEELWDNELNSEVTFYVVKNKATKNIINQQPRTCEELYGCLKSREVEYDDRLKQLLMEKVPANINIDISNNISLEVIENDDALDLEDERISMMIDLEEG